MKKNILFAIYYLCSIGALSALAVFLFGRVFDVDFPAPFWPIPVFYALMPVLWLVLFKAFANNSNAGTMTVLAYRAAKMILALVFLGVMLWRFPEGRLQFAIVFFVFYIILMVFETAYLLSLNKK